MQWDVLQEYYILEIKEIMSRYLHKKRGSPVAPMNPSTLKILQHLLLSNIFLYEYVRCCFIYIHTLSSYHLCIQHKAGINLANRYNPSEPAVTSCGTPACMMDIVPGSYRIVLPAFTHFPLPFITSCVSNCVSWI